VETQPSRVARAADQTRGVIPQALWVQQVQATGSQIKLALVEVEQLPTLELQGHGIHREITAS
jgi:hypothetical protein